MRGVENNNSVSACETGFIENVLTIRVRTSAIDIQKVCFEIILMI